MRNDGRRSNLRRHRKPNSKLLVPLGKKRNKSGGYKAWLRTRRRVRREISNA